MRYSTIRQLTGQFPVRRMCQVLEVSRGGYYDWLRRPKSQRAREDRRLGVEIRALFMKSHRRYGSPRIHRGLRHQGIRCSRKRVARLMRQEGLHARRRRRFRSVSAVVHRERQDVGDPIDAAKPAIQRADACVRDQRHGDQALRGGRCGQT